MLSLEHALRAATWPGFSIASSKTGGRLGYLWCDQCALMGRTDIRQIFYRHLTILGSSSCGAKAELLDALKFAGERKDPRRR